MNINDVPHNKRIDRQRKQKKSRAVFRITITIFVIIFGALVIKHFSQITPNTNKPENMTLAKKEPKKDSKIHSTSSNSDVDLGTSENTDTDKDKTVRYLPLKDDPTADDVAFVEKYLIQQTQGKMPDGADGKKVAYLTFDDGPSENITSSILDVLREENVKATFFILGSTLDKDDNLKVILKRVAKEGHAIGNHTYSHKYKYLYPDDKVNVDTFMSEIEKTNNILRDILGKDFSTRAIRVPGGHMSWKGMDALDDILHSKDYHYVDWNSLSKDSEGRPKNSDELTQEVINTVGKKEKAVILMHDSLGKEETVKALPKIIKYLREQGYELRTMK